VQAELHVVELDAGVPPLAPGAVRKLQVALGELDVATTGSDVHRHVVDAAVGPDLEVEVAGVSVAIVLVDRDDRDQVAVQAAEAGVEGGSDPTGMSIRMLRSAAPAP
jgi:hypothetical protein